MCDPQASLLSPMKMNEVETDLLSKCLEFKALVDKGKVFTLKILWQLLLLPGLQGGHLQGGQGEKEVEPLTTEEKPEKKRSFLEKEN